MKDYLKKIENTYKKWEDVYEKDVNDPYIASDTWDPHCESGENGSFAFFMGKDSK